MARAHLEVTRKERRAEFFVLNRAVEAQLSGVRAELIAEKLAVLINTSMHIRSWEIERIFCEDFGLDSSCDLKAHLFSHTVGREEQINMTF